MVTQQQLKGSWKEIVGGIKRRWGNLTDDELTSVEGSVEQLVGLIQRKTGEGREKIEQFIDKLAQSEGSEGLRDTALQYADQAREKIQHATEQVSESLQTGYAEAEKMMKRHPLESVAVAFGAGLISGLIVGLMIRSR